MSAPAEPIVLAEQGGLVVAERGPEILVIDRGNGPSEITAFVLLIVTLVCGMFGLVAVISSALGGMAAGSGLVGAAILALGVLAGFALFFSAKGIRDRRLRPLTTFTAVAVFDRARRVYRDGTGTVVAPLDQVRFEKQMQLTSSSSKLVAVTPYGTHVLKRGHPFGGGVGTLDRVLNHAVHSFRY